MVRTALSKANRLWCRESNSALRTTGNLAARVVESVKLLVYLERWTSTSRRFSLPLPPALRVPAFSARATQTDMSKSISMYSPDQRVAFDRWDSSMNQTPGSQLQGAQGTPMTSRGARAASAEPEAKTAGRAFETTLTAVARSEVRLRDPPHGFSRSPAQGDYAAIESGSAIQSSKARGRATRHESRSGLRSDATDTLRPEPRRDARAVGAHTRNVGAAQVSDRPPKSPA